MVLPDVSPMVGLGFLTAGNFGAYAYCPFYDRRGVETTAEPARLVTTGRRYVDLEDWAGNRQRCLDNLKVYQWRDLVP